MKARNIGFMIIIAGLSLGVAGCVGNDKYNKDINLLRSQLQLVQSDVENLRSGQQKIEEGWTDAQKRQQGAQAVTGASAVSGSAEIYRTPSGFTLPSRDIQTALKNAGYYNGPVDGKVGAQTQAAIRQFQEDQGLIADGVCGRKTWSKLRTFLEGAAVAATPIK